MIIVIDYDETIVNSTFPNAGTLRRGAKETINRWYDEGHIIIINTCRAREPEMVAYKFLIDSNVKFHCFNDNHFDMILKYETDCRKISGDIYIDDKNIGNKIINWKSISSYVDNYNKKPFIFCLVGESGSGKTTIVDYIEENHNIPSIKSFTDRDKRYDDENGHTFLSKDEFDKIDKNDMIAFTKFGDNRYCATKDSVNLYNTYVIDEIGLDELVDKFDDDYYIITIRIKRDFNERLKCVGEERVKRDVNKFDIHPCYYNYIIVNDDLDKTFDRIDRILEDELNGIN